MPISVTDKADNADKGISKGQVPWTGARGQRPRKEAFANYNLAVYFRLRTYAAEESRFMMRSEVSRAGSSFS